MIKITVIILAVLFMLTGCASNDQTALNEAEAENMDTEILQIADEGGMTRLPYQQISQATARMMMKADDGHVVVDVRRQDEYDEGHIPGAILIPNESIETERPEELPDLYQIILIYCRSGRRSKEAAQKLADMGYLNIYEFGGIIDWEYDIVTSEQENGE